MYFGKTYTSKADIIISVKVLYPFQFFPFASLNLYCICNNFGINRYFVLCRKYSENLLLNIYYLTFRCSYINFMLV